MKKLIVLCALVALAGFVSAEVINAGFEDYDDKTGWGSWASGDVGMGWFGGSSYCYIDTTGNGNAGSDNFMNVNTQHGAGGWGISIFWRLDDAELIPLSGAGTEWANIGAWAKDLSGLGGNLLMKFEWQDQYGNGGGGVATTTPADEVVFDVTTEWVYYEAWHQAPVNSTSIRGVWGNTVTTTDVGIDDIYLIPEPMTIALLGLGGLFLRRRK